MTGTERTLADRARYAYRRLAPFAVPYRRHLGGGVAAAIVVVACRLAFPWPMRGVMEIAFHTGGSRGAFVPSLVPSSGDPIIWLAGAFVAIALLWGVAEYVQRLAMARFSVGTVGDARASALKHLELHAAEGGRDPGDLSQRVLGDSTRLRSGLKSVLIGMSRNGAFFVGVSVIILIIDVPIGLVFVAGGLVAFAIAVRGAVRAAGISRRQRRRDSKLAGAVHGVLSGGAYPTGLKAQRRRKGHADSKATRSEGMTTLAIHAVLAVSTCAIMVLAIHDGRRGTLSPGAIFTILVYVLLMHNKTVSLGRQTIRVGKVLISAERLGRIVKPPSAARREAATRRLPERSPRTRAADLVTRPDCAAAAPPRSPAAEPAGVSAVGRPRGGDEA